MPGHRKRRQFKQTDAFTRGMVIGLKRAGWSIRQIAADTHLGASTVHRLWRRWLEQGNVAIYRNVGATRVTSARVDRRILRQAVAATQATCTAILQHVQDTLDHSISTRTISCRLVANGLHSCRPLRRLPLTPPNRRQRLEWCRARSTWMTEWHRVVFSDESRFCLSSDSRRVRVWRRRGERFNPAAIVERPTVRQRGIMVWGAIAYGSRSPLLRIQGTMTAQRYVDDVLRPVTLPYLQGVPNALYQQDNARPHTARISQQALQDVQILPWPLYSPDLSPIEHVWDIIGRHLHALPQPRSEDELWQMVEREWRAIPQDAIRTLIDSLPRRVAACIAVRAIIHIQDVNGEDQICRALLDNGSQRSLITEKCAATLGIPIRRKRIAVGGLGDQLVESSLGEVFIRFSSHFDHQSFETTALVLTKLTNNIPSFTVKIINYSHMKGLILADPLYFKSREIDVILGSDIVFNLIQEGRRNGNENEPSAIHSKLGWLVYGPTSVSERQSFRNMAHFSSELESEDLIKRFWELESIPLEEIPTKEEKDCESHYLKNVVRDESGRYIVRLPFKESAEKLGQSKSIAIRRFLNLEKRLEQNENIYVQYKQFMNEYIRLGHMQASCSLQTEPKYYIPHHCILKAQPNKLRVVFDASTKTTTQISLNDLLHVGPKLQNNIFSILLKFRTNSVALVADIEKMYRQIRLHPDDIKYQTILWRDRKDLELQEYNLLTVTYGLACAPYLAIRTLHQIAHEVQVSNPRISKIIREDFYVDDLLTGCPTVEDAKGLIQQLIAVLGSGGFVLRKWVSNETSIIEDLPLLLRGKGEVMEFNRKESGVNVLGIQWDPSYDTLNISCKSGPADIKSKRQIVSAIARIYDPCGWLSPTTVVLKLLLQELWKLKIGWDEDIPASIQRKWNTFEREMKHFQQISIPRCIFKRNLLISNMQMHGFCDSSELAYSAVCYLRITYENNQIETILLTAKTKVAPIKKITIPRLELCAALMLAQLQSQTTQALPFNIDEQFYWTDSKIVLAWITSESKKWQIVVANRVAKIQDLTAAHSWQYISGKQNPADLATRGIFPSCLINSKLWWHGPVWLTLDGSENIPSFTIDPSMGLEERSVILHATIAEPCPEFLSKYSSFTKLLRVMAWCKRFINITRKQPTQRLSFLTSQDLKDSLLQIVKIIQRCEFTPEINACIKNIPLPRKRKLISLNIFIDSQGILRVGGRLRHSDLDIDQKHPMLIPKDHFVTKLIVLHYHLNNLHSGTQLTLSLIRNKFWIPSGRNLIKRVLNQCLVCLKSKSKAIHQIMGDLPKNRLLPGRPFEKIGIDLAGPIQAKPMLKRSKVIFKFYIVLFVCFTTKAIHLEISSDLTAEAFLAALKRFISRRGRPTEIYLDNATNFKGASNILKERWKLFKAANIQDFSAIESINWHFIPPSAPNFGGLWEAGIKSVKTILSKTMKSRLLNYEELLTLLAQIEACLNSRPLTFVSNDPNDLSALTPGHFLIGNAMRHDAESDHSTLYLRSRWSLIQPQRDYFWNRWSCEYLHQLQERRKWRTSHPDVNIGDLVMLKEQNKPLQWKLARIVQIFPGEDDHVRVVLLRTHKGLLKRPITKICPLPYKE
ncbi:hypothetical protein LAZ67_1007032 [Cordylochernes scorpioides]|uniref:Integrase catalytic domain-containing protein n=1 Tax=Cordylochernes scorpioides TaxID=51811 RepID=A0ABY6K2L7_9ARAC|nr:hypothetical protein LAZ67_1007032 [Cordylochernes scorpioides]